MVLIPKGYDSIKSGFWWSLIRVEAVSSYEVAVVVVGFDPNNAVVINRSALPRSVDSNMRSIKPGDHLFADVNLGADSLEDLKFVGWSRKNHQTRKQYDKNSKVVRPVRVLRNVGGN